MAPKTLNCTIRYKFSNGDVGHFQGRRRYRLSNSYHDAMEELRAALAYRNESYDAARNLWAEVDPWNWLKNRWTYRGCLIGIETLPDPILIGCNRGVNRYLKSFWRIVFPDGTWIRCGTKQQCRSYIDRGQGRFGVCPQPSIGVSRP